MFQRHNHILILLILFSLIGAVLRFYNLNWGAPYYFHPDERNIASAVTQLSFPQQMNPHFFAYGSLPIYTIYFIDVLNNLLTHCAVTICKPTIVTFAQAILISRFLSAFFSVLLIPLIFTITKKLWNERAGLFAAFITTTSVGLIQFAHFGTFEMWLTFFTVLLFWLCLKATDKLTPAVFLSLALISGILVATKISHLAILPLPLLVILLQLKKMQRKQSGQQIQKIIQRSNTLFTFRALLICLIFGIIVALVYFVANPYVVLDYQGFRNSINYESSVALGALPVFYTGEFYNVIPGLFQFLHVYPFLINPLLTLLFIPAFLFILWTGSKQRNAYFLLLASCFLLLFCSQAFVYVQWTRYMVPTLPFMYMIIAIAWDTVFPKKHVFSIAIPGLICTMFALAFVVTVYIEPDTRIAARDYAATKIAHNAAILSEVYDIGITAFNEKFPDITLFNFYDLDNNSSESNETTLNAILSNTGYVILPSQRLAKIRLNNAKKFPHGHKFYQALFSGQLGFIKIYETPCDVFCNITYLGNPVFNFEETTTVFDRPTIYIFKRM